MKLKIDGMMCNHCKKRVEEAIKSVKGTKKIKVDLGEKTAEFLADPSLLDSVVIKVEEAGYTVTEKSE